jgi:hypothetical protein
MAFLEYSFDSAVKFGGWALSAILLLYTLYRNHISDKRVKRAELAQESAEKRLREIESRGKAPYFAASSELFPQLSRKKTAKSTRGPLEMAMFSMQAASKCLTA